MENELDSLEEKILKVIELHNQLRAENAQLRQTLAARIDDNRRLLERIDEAKRRLASLLTHIPEKAA